MTMGGGCTTSLLLWFVWHACVAWYACALRIGVIHYRPSSMPIKAFEVGFVSAMKVLETDSSIEIEWINCDSFNGKRPEDLHLDRRFDHLDILMVKSNWDWSVDSFVRTHLRDVSVPKVLLISGVTPPPQDDDLYFYDVLVHETQWYWPQIAKHPRTTRAFGIDTDIMRPARNGKHTTDNTVSDTDSGTRTRYDYDYIFVGAFVNYKRPLKLLQKRGRRLAIGKQDADAGPEAPSIAQALRDGGVEVRDLVEHTELAQLMRRSRIVYLPATTVGGGERAVLEARAVGARVEIENDNPKLAELLRGSVPSHRDYAQQLRVAIAMTPLYNQIAACYGLVTHSGPRVILKRQRGGTATPHIRTFSSAGQISLTGEGLACVRKTKAELLLLDSIQCNNTRGQSRRGKQRLTVVPRDAFVTLHNDSALTVFVPSLGSQFNRNLHHTCAPEAQLATLRLRLTASRGTSDIVQALAVQPVLVVPPSQTGHPSLHATRLLIDLNTVRSVSGPGFNTRKHSDEWLLLQTTPSMNVCVPRGNRASDHTLLVTTTEPLCAMHLRAWGVSTMREVVILARDSHKDRFHAAVNTSEPKVQVEGVLDAHAQLMLGAWRLLRAGGVLRLCLCADSFNDLTPVAPSTTSAGRQFLRAIAEARGGSVPSQTGNESSSWPLSSATLERDGMCYVKHDARGQVLPSVGCSVEGIVWHKPPAPRPQAVRSSAPQSAVRPLPWTQPDVQVSRTHSVPAFPLDVLVVHAANMSAEATSALRALREVARYAAMWRMTYWPIDTDAVESRCIIGGQAPLLPSSQLRAANSSHLVLGLGSFRSAVDYVLSYMHLNRGVLSLRPMPKALWLEGSAKPWGEGVYALLLTSTAKQRAVTAAMDGGAGHHNVAVLPSGAIAVVDSGADIDVGSSTDALESLRTSATVRALLTVSPAPPIPPQVQNPDDGTAISRSAVPPPRRYNWAIGTLQGPSVFELSEMSEAPALRRAVAGPDIHAGDVTDRSAVFVADPFIVLAPMMQDDDARQEQKRIYVFFEVLPADMRGVIAVARMNDTDAGLHSGNTRWIYERVVLDEPDAHLSFPYVFNHDGSWYMTVEAHQTKCVPLYRTDALRFPAGWRKLGCLLSGETYQDNALLHHSGWWWLWTTVEMSPHDWRQRLYYARNLGGPYVPHPHSPLNGSNGAMKIGCARGRLGGRLLRARRWGNQMGISADAGTGGVTRRQEALLRFTQVAAPWYGTRLDAWLITHLDQDSYKEEWAGPILLGSRSPLLHPELRGECGTDAEDSRASNSCNPDSGSNQPWQANMMHQLDAVPLDANGSRYLAVVDGASDGGGLQCQLHGDIAWREAERRCAAPLQAALDMALIRKPASRTIATTDMAATTLRNGASYSLPLRFGLDLSPNASDVVVAAMLFGEPARIGDLPPNTFSFSRSAHMLRAAAGNDALQVQLSLAGEYELVVTASACDGVVVRRRSIRFVVEDHNSDVGSIQVQNSGARALGLGTVLQPIRPLPTYPWRCACNGLPAESACMCNKHAGEQK